MAELPRIRAAGAVVWRPGPGEPEVALVHRPRYDDWSLPKGKVDPGEHPATTAVRECREETGNEVVLGRQLGRSIYPLVQGGRAYLKTVQWWAAQSLGGDLIPSSEVDAMRWLPLSQAPEALTARRDGRILDAFAAAPATATLVVLRHARAGVREEWPGPDQERPLDPRGVLQAARIADLLGLWGVRRFVSAPPLRCTATLQPAAARTGATVEVDEALGDEGFARDPDTAVRQLLTLVDPGIPTVVCSQGGALPGMLGALTAAAGMRVALRSRKGRGWVLSLIGHRLVAADPFSPGPAS
ncbi:MAG TPA: NUDIX hydrolase [Mycobacteriales bacterium]|nr:NUDIX hydrolase [Mycobacteriales bacterium]